MKITIFSQYEQELIAKALKKALSVFGIRGDLMRLTSTIDEDLGSLESDAFVILLAPYWAIQPSFILPLFKLVATSSQEADFNLQGLPALRSGNPEILRKCFVISVGPAQFIRPCLSLNLAEVLTALILQSQRHDLGALHLDQTALIELVDAITSVVRHARDPRLWADFLTVLVRFRHSVAFQEIQRTIRTSLASERNESVLTGTVGFLNAPTREAIFELFFPLEALA